MLRGGFQKLTVTAATLNDESEECPEANTGYHNTMCTSEQVNQELDPQDDAALAALYAEFAEEDRALAEMGMADYAAGLDE